MVNIQIVLYCAFYGEQLIDVITQVGRVNCRYAGIDLPYNIFSISFAFGPAQPAVVLLQMQTIPDDIVQCRKPFAAETVVCHINVQGKCVCAAQVYFNLIKQCCSTILAPQVSQQVFVP